MILILILLAILAVMLLMLFSSTMGDLQGAPVAVRVGIVTAIATGALLFFSGSVDIAGPIALCSGVLAAIVAYWIKENNK